MAQEEYKDSKDDEGRSELGRYLEEIGKYEREFKKWEARVEKIIKRYRDEGREARSNAQSRFNILWSNVQTLIPATFAKLPQPDVSRRFRDNDPTGRVASLILERALDFEIQHYNDYRVALKQCVSDRFLGGRGTAWARYEPHFQKAKKTGQDPEGVQITDNQEADTEATEILDYECAPVDYVHWRDFGHSVARTWEEVTLVWRRVYMDKEAVKERFGKEMAEELSYDSTPDDLRKTARQAQENWKQQAIIYELWDKTEGCAYWLSKGYKDDFLDERDDPLGLQEFFPCPRPLYATLTNETLVPVPDFILYQDQANELDILSDRIDGLTRMLQLKGTYDASTPELRRLFTEGENGTLTPVKNWGNFVEKGGLQGGINLYDLKPHAEALRTAQEAMEQVKNQVYEITGISDIVRGAQSEHAETATEQNIKGQYSSLRLKAMQDDVARFATDLLQLKAQIMCGKFNPQTLAAAGAVDQLNDADKQVIPQALELLVGPERLQNPEAEAPNPLRSFRIEIAADTMVQMNEQQEKQDRTELLTAFGSFLEKAVQAPPQLIPLLVELGKFGLTAFKVGKTIEGACDTALEQLKKAPQQPPPDPQMAKVHSDHILAQQEQQQAAQAEASKAQREQQQQQFDAQQEAQKQALEAQRLQFEQQTKQQEDNFNRWKAELDAATKIEVAQISANAGLQQAQISAENAAAETIGKDLNGKAVAPMQEMIKGHGELLKTLQKGQEQKPKRRTGKITAPSGQQYQIDMTEQ